MLRKSLIAALIIIPALSGCAITTGTAPLTVQPVKNVAALPGAENVVVDVRVKNEKKHKWIGRKKDGLGISLARIYPKGSISGTVRDAIEKELVARGFGAGNNGHVVVDATVKELHNAFEMGLVEGEAVAKLNMEVAVLTTGGKELFSKDITAKGETGAMLTSGHNAGVAVDRALQAGIKTLFDDPAFIQALFAAGKESQ